jgi:hypothetical protein
MTDLVTLLALAERCEQAAGPDRELDFAIAAGVGWPDSPNLHQHARRYTESLDAAVTLVPEGWRYDLTNGDLISKEKPAARLTPDFAGPCFNGYARTVPLALCIAALRARAAAHD